MTYVINSLKKNFPLHLFLSELTSFIKTKETELVTSSPGYARGGICDVEAKMAAPLSTMKFWKPGK